MASLYGDLLQSKDGTSEAPSSWSTAPKLKPLLRKPSNLLTPPPSILRAGRGAGRGLLAPGRGAGRGPPPSTSQAPTAAAEEGAPALVSSGPSTSLSIFATNGPIQDEYDPARPNDYEEVMRERERQKQEALAEAERQAKLKEMEAAMERLREQEAASEQQGASAGPAGEAQRESMLNISGEEAYLRRARLGRGGSAPGPNAGPLPGPPADMMPEATAGLASSKWAADEDAAAAASAPKGMTLAQRLLEKMGWKEGEGLGKNRQGMSTPLVAQKTDRRAGVIVNAEAPAAAAAAAAGTPQRTGLSRDPDQPLEKKPRTGAMIQGVPSKVLCLRNMVGPGEVDEELEDEVGNELTKYGNVTSVMIFEVTEPNYPAEEAVRIFVQFDRVESATKAMVDLQGRFFGGRNVRVAFFNETRFEKTDLAPAPGEFEGP